MPRDKIPPGMLKKILKFNQDRKTEQMESTAGKVLAKAIGRMPPGQKKQFLTPEVIEALKTLGIDTD